MGRSKLFVVFTSDTEDNYPNYVPLWKNYGSNYNSNPADLKWNWSQYWDNLSELFTSKNVPVTWLMRVDNGPVFDQMLVLFKDKILGLQSTGDEIGIHVHTYDWNPTLSMWIQTQDPEKEKKVIIYSLEVFRKNLGFFPSSIRMGWNTMSNEIMRTLDANGLEVDASAIPGTLSSGKFSKRDNIYDWSRTPNSPYHPSFEDYQEKGRMRILEIPLSTLKTEKPGRFTTLVNKLSSFPSLVKLVPLARYLNLTPHHHFYMTPHWSSSLYDKIIEEKYREAKKKGLAFLVGYFHASDILYPSTLTRNRVFEKRLDKIIEKINSLTEVEVEYVTLSKLAKVYNNMRQDKK